MRRYALRPGLSLIEVLAAIFIMGVGVIAILTLFPLGAMYMAQAFRDDRTALAAHNADQFLRSYWKKMVESKGGSEAFFHAMGDPDGPTGPLPPAQPGEPSYPMMVDPMGYVARLGRPDQTWLGDVGLGGSPPLPAGRWTHVPRHTLSVVGTNPLAALSLCSLLDGVLADDDGNVHGRELRYNYLWILQRPNNANLYHASMTVVVFDRRAHLYVPPDGSEPIVHGVVFNPGQTQLLLPNVSPRDLDLRSGGWIMDATIHDGSSGLGRPGMRHAHFYRISAVSEAAGGTLLQLQSPIRTPEDGGGPYTGTVVIPRGVCGVSVRPPLNRE